MDRSSPSPDHTPVVARSGTTRDRWTEADSQRLSDLKDLGRSWQEIASHFPTRTVQACRQRYYTMGRLRIAEESQHHPPIAQPSNTSSFGAQGAYVSAYAVSGAAGHEALPTSGALNIANASRRLPVPNPIASLYQDSAERQLLQNTAPRTAGQPMHGYEADASGSLHLPRIAAPGTLRSSRTLPPLQTLDLPMPTVSPLRHAVFTPQQGRLPPGASTSTYSHESHHQARLPGAGQHPGSIRPHQQTVEPPPGGRVSALTILANTAASLDYLPAMSDRSSQSAPVPMHTVSSRAHRPTSGLVAPITSASSYVTPRRGEGRHQPHHSPYSQRSTDANKQQRPSAMSSLVQGSHSQQAPTGTAQVRPLQNPTIHRTDGAPVSQRQPATTLPATSSDTRVERPVHPTILLEQDPASYIMSDPRYREHLERRYTPQGGYDEGDDEGDDESDSEE